MSIYRRFTRAATVLCLGLALAACGSSPRNEYFVLSAPDLPPGAADSPSIGIGPIEVPEYLAREKIVFRKGPNALQVSDTQKWAEPLQHGVARLLALNLSSLSGSQNIRFFPWHSGRPPQYGVKVTLMALDAGPEGATLTAEWLVYSPSGEAFSRNISRLKGPIEGEVNGASAAAAYSQLLLELSEEIYRAVPGAQTAP